MADIASDIDGVVTTDGTWGRGQWVGGTEEGTTGLDGITSFPDHGADWARVHVVDKTSKEWLVGEISIVLLEVLLSRAAELDASKLVTTSLKSADDWADESTLDTIWLDGNEGLFVRHGIVI